MSETATAIPFRVHGREVAATLRGYESSHTLSSSEIEMLREMSLALRKALPDEDDNFVVQAAYGTAWGAHAGSGMRFRNMCAHIQLTSNALESIAKGEDPNGITVRELRRLMWEIGRPVQPSQRGCDR